MYKVLGKVLKSTSKFDYTIIGNSPHCHKSHKSGIREITRVDAINSIQNYQYHKTLHEQYGSLIHVK